MLCEMCEYARFGENSSRFPLETTGSTTNSKGKGTTQSPPETASSTPNSKDKGKTPSKNKCLCNQCKKNFNVNVDKALNCGRCEEWVCRSCSKVTLNEYEIISKKNSKVRWFCAGCDEEAMSAIKTSKLIEEKCKLYIEPIELKLQDLSSSLQTKADEAIVADLHMHIETLTSKLETLTSKLESLDTTSYRSPQADDIDQFMKKQEEVNSALEKKLQTNTAQIASVSMKELKEREDRRANIMFFNIPESASDSIDQRKLDDKNHVEKILSFLEVDQELTKPVRLGKKSDHPRPLRLVANSLEAVGEILKAARKMAYMENPMYKKVGINKDMTFLERQEHRALLKERKRRMEDAQEKGIDAKWVIKDASLVNLLKRTSSSMDPVRETTDKHGH